MDAEGGMTRRRRSIILRHRAWATGLLLIVLVVSGFSRKAAAESVQSSSADLPELTAPVNDFAHVVDASSARGIEQLIRALKDASGDVVVVATVATIEPYGDIR